MGDKRTACRVRRRLPLMFSDGKQQHRGQTANMSRTGLCIHSDYVVTPGTELSIKLGLPGISEIRVQAVVEWARKLRSTELLQSAHSMGVRYLAHPGPEYDDFMSIIEGLAQPHGLATKAADAPAAPQRREPAVATPHRAPAAAPTAARHTPRHVRAADPRREPDAAAVARPQREIVEVHGPIVEVPQRQETPAAGHARPEQNFDFVVTADDLAASGDYACSLSTARVAFLLEQGAAELAAPRLQRRMATVGMSLEVSVTQEPLAVGTALEVVVRLVGVGRERGTFVFDIEVKDGDRLVASGRHERKVVQATA